MFFRKFRRIFKFKSKRLFYFIFTILRGEFNSPFYTNRHSKNQILLMLDEVLVSGKNLPVEKNNKVEIRYTESK